MKSREKQGEVKRKINMARRRVDCWSGQRIGKNFKDQEMVCLGKRKQ